MDVPIKMMAANVVILFNKGTGPSVPNNDWLDPPKDAPISAPLPCCNKTMQMRKTQTITCTAMSRVVIEIEQSEQKIQP